MTTYDDADEAIQALVNGYRRGMWQDQPDAVYLASEKDSIRGVLSPVSRRWDVPLGILRGYASETFSYELAASLNDELEAGHRHVYVYNLGDHDPSGADAWRAVGSRVRSFLADTFHADPDAVTFDRLAVTERQITDLDLPTRPTKKTDTRTKTWTGGDSVEVDAIPAPTLREIVESAITAHVDTDALAAHETIQARQRKELAELRGLVA